MRRPGARLARNGLLRQPEAAAREFGVYADDSGPRKIIRGDAISLDVPPAPYNARGRVDIHHTHPNALIGGSPAPLSDGDIAFLADNPRVAAILAHETSGGGSVAMRGARTGKLRNDRVLAAGYNAAREALFGVDHAAYLAQIPMARAAKRHGALSRYGYRAAPEHVAMIDDNAEAFTRAENAAFRAMHEPIYGLPYPLTWSRIAGTGAALAAARALAEGGQ